MIMAMFFSLALRRLAHFKPKQALLTWEQFQDFCDGYVMERLNEPALTTRQRKRRATWIEDQFALYEPRFGRGAKTMKGPSKPEFALWRYNVLKERNRRAGKKGASRAAEQELALELSRSIDYLHTGLLPSAREKLRQHRIDPAHRWRFPETRTD